MYRPIAMFLDMAFTAGLIEGAEGGQGSYLHARPGGPG